jgi:hypothetical protein
MYVVKKASWSMRGKVGSLKQFWEGTCAISMGNRGKD